MAVAVKITLCPGMDPLLRDYLRGLEARKLSPESIRSNRSTLERLAEMLGKPLVRLTPDDVADWQAQRAGIVSARTLRKDVSHVRSLYRWAASADRITDNPARRLQPPKVPRLLPRPMPEHRLTLAFAHADNRMRAILGLAAYAGLRAREIAGLTWLDVALDAAEPTMRVLGKGEAERVLDISPQLAALLVVLPARRGPVVRRGDGLPGPNTPNRVSKMANGFLRDLGIPDTLHSLRHLCLTEACQIGGIRVAQEIAGHASISTTAPYTRVAPRDLREVMHAVGRRIAS